ncbi:hypothetical protein KCA24_34940, partial [Escherichia coli]|nr:hypothetical protein [Escherichia coli]
MTANRQLSAFPGVIQNGMCAHRQRNRAVSRPKSKPGNGWIRQREAKKAETCPRLNTRPKY